MTADIEVVLLEEVNCCACGIRFGIAQNLYERRLDDHKPFYCPNGHGQHFTPPPKERDVEMEELRAAANEAREDYASLARQRKRRREFLIIVRYITASACALTLAVSCSPTAIGASVSTLHHRQSLQVRSLHRWTGAVTFFHNHLVQARSRIGRFELRRAHIWLKVLRRELAETVAALRPRASTVPQIICAVFRGQCAKALAVFGCESHYNVSARNGQYFGIGQMGSAERARFGGSSLDPWEQVRAAYRYYLIAGWGPWSCA